MIQDALCPKCAKDGDEYHKHVNKYPLGTTFRCMKCVKLFGGIVDEKPADVDSLEVRSFFLPVLVFLLVMAFVLLGYIYRVRGGEADEYYQQQMRRYRYGSVTNEVRGYIHYEYHTNIIEHGRLKREVVYLLEVMMVEGRTNKYVLSDEFISDTIIK